MLNALARYFGLEENETNGGTGGDPDEKTKLTNDHKLMKKKLELKENADSKKRVEDYARYRRKYTTSKAMSTYHVGGVWTKEDHAALSGFYDLLTEEEKAYCVHEYGPMLKDFVEIK